MLGQASTWTSSPGVVQESESRRVGEADSARRKRRSRGIPRRAGLNAPRWNHAAAALVHRRPHEPAPPTTRRAWARPGPLLRPCLREECRKDQPGPGDLGAIRTRVRVAGRGVEQRWGACCPAPTRRSLIGRGSPPASSPKLDSHIGGSATGGGSGDPGAIRTRDPQLRRLVLYPAELPGHVRHGCAEHVGAAVWTGPPLDLDSSSSARTGGAYWTRTSDPRGVNTVLYQLS